MFVWSSFKKVFAGYADFKAKTDPRDFFFGLGWLFVIQVAYQLVRGMIFDANGPDFEAAFAKQQTVQLVLNGLLYLPLIALVTRRLNDMTRSAWCALPLAATVLASNLNAAYGAWIDTSHATRVMQQEGGWFASASSVLVLLMMTAWLFTVGVTISWGTPKPEISVGAPQ